MADWFLLGLGVGDHLSEEGSLIKTTPSSRTTRVDAVAPRAKSEIATANGASLDRKRPAADADDEEKATKEALSEEVQQQNFLTHLRKFIGADIMNLVCLPISFMEPLSTLQRMAEIMEYAHLLDSAAGASDPVEALAWVTAFCYSIYGCIERVYKPFDPILGETFQLDLPCGGRFLAEQVSHHPPIGVAHAENARWEYDVTSAPKTKYFGNSLVVFPHHITRIRLKHSGEMFSVSSPSCCVYGILIQRMWIDVYGSMVVQNMKTGARSDTTFKPCGWFGGGFHEASGLIRDSAGVPRLALEGLWNERLRSVACDGDGAAVPGCDARTLWQCSPKPAGQAHGLTAFASEQLGAAWQPASARPWPLLRTDSRLRPDRRALQLGDGQTAQSEKPMLEQRQRREKARRGDGQRKPLWFQALAEGAQQRVEGESTPEECPSFGFLGKWPSSKMTSDQICTFHGVESPAVCRERFKPWEYEE
eukprot:TRINITY_DN28140_c0_g1_i1.p1 TRINITY_DN28140_c0_g1~~TRINITY_DN28140_c0_g1_i1.p1  ORF type:complete len:513 (-),score=121.49 TRINITY_DN28140_c0_g1_i1:75-1505(-)